MIPELPFPLEPAGTPPCEYEVKESSLILRSGPMTDLFIDPAGPSTEPPDAGRLTGLPPAGDFTLSARITVDFASKFDAGVLLVHVDDEHWAKLCFEYSPQRKPTAVTVVTRQTSDDCNSFEVQDNELWLRITRTGQAWAFHASRDGHWWHLLRYFALAGPARIGFLAQSPTGQGSRAAFDQIVFGRAVPADLRDGT
jgi:regulation of enolase protein 1 (concanavalin A-like superfamily)